MNDAKDRRDTVTGGQAPGPGRAPAPWQEPWQEPGQGQAPGPGQTPGPGQAPGPGQTPGPGQAPAPIRALLGLVLGLAVLGLATLAGCGGDYDKAEFTAKDVACQTAVAEIRPIPLFVPATASLEASKSVKLSTRMMGWIRRIHVAAGDTVATGSPLISIDDTDLRAQKEQLNAQIHEAEAVLKNAESSAARFEMLFAEQSVSRQQLDDARTGRDRAVASLKAAQARRDELDVQLGYLEITAPFDGVVARKLNDEGNMATPGEPLLILEQTGRMKVVARLGEKHIGAVREGDLVTVDITSLPGARFTVPIANIVLTANPGSRTYDIEAYVDNPDGRLMSGMFARVDVPVGMREAVVVPVESIIARGQLRGLFVVDEAGTARLRWIRLGRATEGGLEVLSGLAGGETIVVSSEVPLTEGDRVVK